MARRWRERRPLGILLCVASHSDPSTNGAGPSLSGTSLPSAKSARTRRSILDAAAQIFMNRDVNSVKVEEIAEAAGVSVGTLYKHFTSKQGILLAFVSDGLDIVERYMAEARAQPRAIDRVYAAGDAYVRFAIERPESVRFAAVRVMQPDPSPELAEINQALSARVQKIVLGIATDLKEAMTLGQTATAPIDEMMLFLWALWNGMTSLMVRQDGTAIPAEAAERALELARGVMRRASIHAQEHPEPVVRGEEAVADAAGA